jgi:pyruvate kinase
VTLPAEAQPRRAKIIATLGPATDGLERELVDAGVDVARLNFSHGAPEEHARRCAAIRAAAAELGRCVAIMQDLQGPKIRIGRLAGSGPIELAPGQMLTITTRDVVGNAERIGCTYPELTRDVAPGDHVLLDDGRIRLVVVEVAGDEVRTRVEEGGPLAEHKGINLPGVAVSAPALTEKDRQDLRFGLRELGVDYVALSFIRAADEVHEGRALVRSLGRDTPLLVKLERPEAVERLEALLAVADGVMVARGDLGVEMAPEQVPMLQKTIIHQANQRGIPVITATQMLESMVSEETPTRAEATDVANAIWDGSDAVMLSAETAVGRHPLLAVRMMQRIVCAAEAAALPSCPAAAGGDRGPRGQAAAVTHAARVLAEDLGATAIVGVTRTGRTAELLSWGRARVPTYAFSPDERVCRRLALWWGVTAVHHPLAESLEGNIEAMEAHLVRCGLARPGDTVVITGSHPFRAGVHTNFVKYQVVGQPAG